MEAKKVAAEILALHAGLRAVASCIGPRCVSSMESAIEHVRAREELAAMRCKADAHDDLVKALQAFVKAVRLSRMSCEGRSVECELADQILTAEEALAKAGAA